MVYILCEHFGDAAHAAAAREWCNTSENSLEHRLRQTYGYAVFTCRILIIACINRLLIALRRCGEAHHCRTDYLTRAGQNDVRNARREHRGQHITRVPCKVSEYLSPCLAEHSLIALAEVLIYKLMRNRAVRRRYIIIAVVVERAADHVRQPCLKVLYVLLRGKREECCKLAGSFSV